MSSAARTVCVGGGGGGGGGGGDLIFNVVIVNSLFLVALNLYMGFCNCTVEPLYSGHH